MVGLVGESDSTQALYVVCRARCCGSFDRLYIFSNVPRSCFTSPVETCKSSYKGHTTHGPISVPLDGKFCAKEHSEGGNILLSIRAVPVSSQYDRFMSTVYSRGQPIYYHKSVIMMFTVVCSSLHPGSWNGVVGQRYPFCDGFALFPRSLSLAGFSLEGPYKSFVVDGRMRRLKQCAFILPCTMEN